jgi:solute carrier family 25 citrate transporter 1
LDFVLANFTAYSYLRQKLSDYHSGGHIPGWQTSLIGLISGAMGPFSNAPIDTIKTRLQKAPAKAGETAMSRIVKIATDMWKQEGVQSFYKGITPRVMRVAPGQAVTFTVYEYLRAILEKDREMPTASKYEE